MKMKTKTTTITTVSIEMNKQDIIKGINKHLKRGKIFDNVKVFVTVPGGGNYSNMDLDIDYETVLEIGSENDSKLYTLNKDMIFQLLYGDQETPNDFKVFITVSGWGDWSGMKLEIGEDTSLFVEYTEKEIK